MKTSVNIRGARSQAKHVARKGASAGAGTGRSRHRSSKHGLNLHNTPESVNADRLLVATFIGSAIAVVLFH